MYTGGYIKTGPAGIEGGYTAGPGSMTDVAPADPWRDYFFTNHPGKWIGDERAEAEYARIYGEEALQQAKYFGVAAENIDPAAVGGTILGDLAGQRTVYDLNTGDVAVEVNPETAGRGADMLEPVGPPTPAPKVQIPSAGPEPVPDYTVPDDYYEVPEVTVPARPPTEIPWWLIAAGAALLILK